MSNGLNDAEKKKGCKISEIKKDCKFFTDLGWQVHFVFKKLSWKVFPKKWLMVVLWNTSEVRDLLVLGSLQWVLVVWDKRVVEVLEMQVDFFSISRFCNFLCLLWGWFCLIVHGPVVGNERKALWDTWGLQEVLWCYEEFFYVYIRVCLEGHPSQCLS